jgi:hypothetical protein
MLGRVFEGDRPEPRERSGPTTRLTSQFLEAADGLFGIASRCSFRRGWRCETVGLGIDFEGLPLRAAVCGVEAIVDGGGARRRMRRNRRKGISPVSTEVRIMLSTNCRMVSILWNTGFVIDVLTGRSFISCLRLWAWRGFPCPFPRWRAALRGRANSGILPGFLWFFGRLPRRHARAAPARRR